MVYLGCMMKKRLPQSCMKQMQIFGFKKEMVVTNFLNYSGLEF